MYIRIRWSNGYLLIEDSYGHWYRYLYYTKREALSMFKERFGYRYKHGITIYDETKRKEKH